MSAMEIFGNYKSLNTALTVPFFKNRIDARFLTSTIAVATVEYFIIVKNYRLAQTMRFDVNRQRVKVRAFHERE